MSRPIYVQAIDELRERLSVECFRNFLGKFGVAIDPSKLEKLDRIDFELSSDDSLAAYYEHKWRHPRNQNFSTWFASNSKIEAAFERSEANDLPLFLVYTWGTEVWYASITRKDRVAIRPGGRFDRNDPFDEEMMAHFPREIFRKIGEIPL
jgi:hypothetical protein